jgi:hypothetical protein
MVRLTDIEDALNGIDANTADLGARLVNMARDLGLSEDQIVDALAGEGVR